MFTGIVEEIGTVSSVLKGTKSSKIGISANIVVDEIKIGDSISTNGVCLTATKLSQRGFEADVMAESLRRSNLGDLKVGDKVNLERALKSNGRFDGHIVSGHIDNTGTIVSYVNEDNAVWIEIEAVSEVLKYIVHKGSVALDGVSLTVAYIDDKTFKVSIIPHTAAETTLLNKKVGDRINIECDVVGKYIEKLLNYSNTSQTKQASKIDESFLRLHGF